MKKPLDSGGQEEECKLMSFSENVRHERLRVKALPWYRKIWYTLWEYYDALVYVDGYITKEALSCKCSSCVSPVRIVLQESRRNGY